MQLLNSFDLSPSVFNPRGRIRAQLIYLNCADAFYEPSGIFPGFLLYSPIKRRVAGQDPRTSQLGVPSAPRFRLLRVPSLSGGSGVPAGIPRALTAGMGPGKLGLPRLDFNNRLFTIPPPRPTPRCKYKILITGLTGAGHDAGPGIHHRESAGVGEL